MSRIYSLLIGYALGCILTADIIAKISIGKSAFSIGTGNPGMANVGAQLGTLRAAAVLMGDLAKTFIACAIARIAFSDNAICAAYAGLGAVLGHDFPFWNGFCGGQGVTATCASFAVISLPFAVIACVAGLIISIASGYLAIGAICISAIFLIYSFTIGLEYGAVCLSIFLIMLIKQFPALKRIARGEQKKAFRKNK